ncbi:unnamed protein product [Peniophora sp. CBMAI 1063]|nr:unnamed protein product [Peniophora sp. CBMAI 1063]
MTTSTGSKPLKPPKASPARRSNSATTMKQQKLGFSSSKPTRNAGDKDKSKPSRSASLEATPPTSLVTPKRISIRSSVRDDDELPTVREKEPEIEVIKRDPLDADDKRWNRAYGVARDLMGNIAPIHSEGQTKVHHILRVFDMNYEYGPCIGVTRLQRWQRAEALGLDPPREVFEILNTQEGIEKNEFAQCVLYEPAVQA